MLQYDLAPNGKTPQNQHKLEMVFLALQYSLIIFEVKFNLIGSLWEAIWNRLTTSLTWDDRDDITT